MDLVANDPQEFENLKKNITSIVGFDCSYYTDNFLKRRIEVRLRYLKMDSYKNYSKFLSFDPQEMIKIKKELTIHTTNFFRDSSLYKFLIDDLIPHIKKIKKENHQKNIRVWSAGCSTGEEALSIAICFIEALGNDLSGFNIQIQGTDYSQSTVDKANKGEYFLQQFSEMPFDLQQKYFDKIEGDQEIYKPKGSIKRLVSFRLGDIITQKPSNMDVVFCRNTVIYFDTPTKSKLYLDIYNSLPVPGYFVMGKTEMLLGDARDKFNIYNLNERIYVKE